MRNEEIKINETYYTRVSGELVKVKVVGEVKVNGRRMWSVSKCGSVADLSPRNAQALHLTSNPLKERAQRGAANRQLKTDKLRGFAGSRTERVSPVGEDKIRELNKQRFRKCPHCGRPAASPSSNLCGDALMGRDCRPTLPCGCIETPPDLDLDAETIDCLDYPGSILDSAD